MAFLIKYIAFVVALLSAAKLVESVELKLVDDSDADAVQAYADLGRETANINDVMYIQLASVK